MIADTDTHAILSWLEHVDTSRDDGQRTRTHCPKESADRYGARVKKSHFRRSIQRTTK